MEKLPRRNGVRVMSIAVVLLVGLTSAAASSASHATVSRHKHRQRYLPVRCEDPGYRNVIAQTGSQLIAQYNAMGFSIGSPQDVAAGGGTSIDGATPGEAGRYVGTQHLKGGVSTGVREGNEFDDDDPQPRTGAVSG